MDYANHDPSEHGFASVKMYVSGQQTEG